MHLRSGKEYTVEKQTTSKIIKKENKNKKKTFYKNNKKLINKRIKMIIKEYNCFIKSIDHPKSQIISPAKFHEFNDRLRTFLKMVPKKYMGNSDIKRKDYLSNIDIAQLYLAINKKKK